MYLSEELTLITQISILRNRELSWYRNMITVSQRLRQNYITAIISSSIGYCVVSIQNQFCYVPVQVRHLNNRVGFLKIRKVYGNDVVTPLPVYSLWSTSVETVMLNLQIVAAPVAPHIWLFYYPKPYMDRKTVNMNRYYLSGNLQNVLDSKQIICYCINIQLLHGED